MRKQKTLPVLQNVTVIDAGAEGKAIAKENDLVIFIDNAVPGDIADIQITRKKNKYREGKAIHFHHYSDQRAEVFCEHFGVCGGCKWQNMKYESQLFYKQKQVYDTLTRIGKIDMPEMPEILSSKKEVEYRNKLEYTFSNKKWLTEEEINSGKDFNNRNALGFHIPKMFDKVLDINTCYLQAAPSNEIRLAVKNYALENKLAFFDLREQTGFLRNLIIRTSSTGEVMVIVAFFYEDVEAREKLLNFIAERFPQISSLLFVINPKKNDTISDLEIKTFKGNDCIYEQMEGLKFKIGPKSFYQTNSEQAYELYKIVRDFASLKGNEHVYDLYTGTGTIANFIARNAAKVIGIEYISAAIDDAKTNSKNNEISNTSFYAGDMKDVLTDAFIAENGKPDVIITDPPRAGMHEDVVMKISDMEPQKIVYVSCNPATQARDLAMFNSKYTVARIQAVDMFPHTHHVENVVLLEKRQ